MRHCLWAIVTVLSTVPMQAQQPPADSAAPVFKLEEVMIPVRDGVHLQTAILTPVHQAGPLPILFTRTPYGVPDKAPTKIPTSFK
ncbi:MAG TPA: CocE/NonD family hydrolase, partial [Gemmatimonadales bacterium]|nr:CocE/NonD family hydrolase [Gemmatimonadales bacterium]